MAPLLLLLLARTVQIPVRIAARSTNDGIEMVYVPAGEFTMGGNFPDQKPIHKVYLDGYWIGERSCHHAGAGDLPWFRSLCHDYGNPTFDGAKSDAFLSPCD